MNMSPGAIYHTSCSTGTQTPLESYHPPRIAVGPDTKAIRVNVDRAAGAGFASQKDLPFVMRVKDKLQPSVYRMLNSAGYANYQAIFEVAGSGLFTTKGLHFVDIMHNDCCVGQIEVIYAPPLYVNGGEAMDSTCGQEGETSCWEEPECGSESTCDRDIGATQCNKTCDVSVPIRRGYGT